MVGAKGFEPSTSWSRTRRASQAALRPERFANFPTSLRGIHGLCNSLVAVVPNAAEWRRSTLWRSADAPQKEIAGNQLIPGGFAKNVKSP